MKKSLSILSALAIMLSLTACNGDMGNSGNSGTSVQSGSTAESQSTVQEESSTPSSTSDSEEKPQMNNSAKLGEFKQTATISETVMVDENDVKITATGLNYQNYAFELELLIENNSTKDLSFVSGSMGYCCNSINGIMVSEGYFNCDVPAGKKATDNIHFNYNGLMLYGINELADIEIGFDISDDDYNHTYTGPRQVKTSVSDSFNYGENRYQATINSDESKNTYNYTIEHFKAEDLYNENEIKVVSAAVMTNKDGNKALLLETVNNSSEQINLVTSRIGINGLLVQNADWSYDLINPGKTCIVDIDLSKILRDSYWDIYGINDIGELSLELTAKRSDGSIITDAKPIAVKINDSNAKFDASGNEVYSGNGIRIISKGVVESGLDYSKNMYAMFIIENTNSERITVDDVYNSLSVNGFVCDYSFPNTTIEANGYAMLEVTLRESSLESNKISAASDITEMEVSVDIKNGSDKLDSPIITVKY